MSEAHPVVVVGFDGSDASKDALRWAARQAQLTDGEVNAVIAWDFPPTYGFYVDYSEAEFAGHARTTLEEAVAEVLGDPPPVPITVSAVRGRPAEVVIEASQSADLLVVGTRGRGAFTGMLLGSVSQHCVQHAACPVVVVRPRAVSRPRK
ncbi:universal stress protein [Mycobacterium sp.]|uniref:universal stress protein n=1 Tax=Mycobacterium sp. TaxID=1785 RepID=UPI0031DC0D92